MFSQPINLSFQIHLRYFAINSDSQKFRNKHMINKTFPICNTFFVKP